MTDDGFLGRGWAYPPRFSRGGGVVDTVGGTDDVHESLHILLATRPGERAMREDFGCELSALMFEEVDQTLINRLSRLVSNAILDHEPRVRLDGVEVDTRNAADGLVRFQIAYTIQGTNSRFNMVYPFYLEEAATPGPR
ncbi:MAG: GPW/gp25 family protein [Acidobacteriota bacterium]